MINMSRGAFTQTGSILEPYAQFYGIDAGFYGGAHAISRLFDE
jgi:hypothetical protein